MEITGNKDKIIFIVGPTAAGKSGVALETAKFCNGEIISCDAMQIYKEIRIASNRPSDNEIEQVPHHLVGFLSVTEDFDVARFNHLARESISSVLTRDKVPIVVGGSGMYVSILLDGIFSSGGRDNELREQLMEQAENSGSKYLYDRLCSLDPAAAAKVHSNDLRRIIRALEVIEVDKSPISQLQGKREGLWGKYNITIYCISRERDDLYDRINSRVEKMFAAGIIDEIKRLENLKLSRTAGALIGVKEVRAYLDGVIELEEAKEQLKRNTRRYAKRQLTWFRKDQRLKWILIKDEDEKEIAQRIIEDLKR
jgi:tRNA dimethylallyltransferase